MTAVVVKGVMANSELPNNQHKDKGMITMYGCKPFWRIYLIGVLILITTACGGGGDNDKSSQSSGYKLNASFVQEVSGLNISVDASASLGDVVNYQWDFGDGNSSSGITASHIYSVAGTYTIQLTVIDEKGNSNSSSIAADIISPNSSDTPVVGFVVDSQIVGMRYVSTNKANTLTIEGVTSGKGEYKYFADGKTVFYIGSIKIASVISPEAITPISLLFNTETESKNVARFLQTIDSDLNPDNGIQIASYIDANSQSKMISDVGLTFDDRFDEKFKLIKSILFKDREIPETITTEQAIIHSSKSERLLSIKEFDLYKAIANQKNYRSESGYYNANLLEADQRKRTYLWIWESLLQKEMEIQDELLFSTNKFDIDNVEGDHDQIKKYLDLADAVISLGLTYEAGAEIAKKAGSRTFGYELTKITSLTISGCDAIVKFYKLNETTGEYSEDDDSIDDQRNGLCQSVMSILNPVNEPESKLAITNPVLIGIMPDLLPKLTHALKMKNLKTVGSNISFISKQNIPKMNLVALSISVSQIMNDYGHAYWASRVNEELTSHIIAKEWLSAWFRSGANAEYMNFLINDNKEKLVGMDEQINALALKFGSSGFLCEAYNFFNPFYKCTGLEHINYDHDKVKEIITDYLAKSNAVFRNLVDDLGPVSDENNEIGISTIDWTNSELSPENVAANQAPTANAGVDITINDGEVVNLNGSASRDPDGSIATYEWWLNGQLLGSSSRISLSKLAVGSHVATLIVKDNQGLVDSDTVTIVVKVVPPRLDVSASALDFGSVAYDISGAKFGNKTLTISNGGGQPLTNIKLAWTSNNNVFTLSDASSFTLEPGASRVLTISAVSKNIGDFTGTLQVTADGGFSKNISLKAAVIANNLVHRVIPSASALLVNDALTLRIEMTNGNPEYAITVNWGDGQTGSYSTTSDVMSASHTYTKAVKGTIQVSINDFAGKTGLTTLPITVTDTVSLSSQWSAQAHHIETDETATDVPIQISEQTLSSNLVQRYTTNWAPAYGGNNEYFIKYRLPVPAGLIKLDRKMRMAVVMSASSIAAFDRELAFVTDQGEMLASWRGETEPALPGYLQYKPVDGGAAQVMESVALNDDPQTTTYQSYAVELNNQQFDAQSYKNNSYSSLANLAINGGTKLNELNITFKGNGAISLVKFEYDANNNGAYDDGAIFANTADKTVDWSVYSGVTPPVTTVAGHLNDTGITSCADDVNNNLPCPVAGFPGQDAESGRDATANDDSDGHAGFSFTKLDGNGQPLAASATEWSCVKDNVTGLMWEIHTDDGGLRDKNNTYSWYNSDATTNGGDAGTQNGGSCAGGIACDTLSYVTAVNAQGLCGYHDWRLPTVTELQGLVDFSLVASPALAIDTKYFPDSVSSDYWSPSAEAGNGASNAWAINFNTAGVDIFYKSNAMSLRLVRIGR